MGKKSVLAGLLLSVCLIFSGCAASDSGEVKQSLTYSNLVDNESKDKLRGLLVKAGVDDNKIDLFFKDVDEYNNIVEGSGLVESGFKTIDSFVPEYDEGKIVQIWDEKGLIGHNCRITAFRLLSDFVEIPSPKIEETTMLFADKEMIDSRDDLIEKAKQVNFYNLFSYIPTSDSLNVDDHIKVLQENWKEKGVVFKNKEASFISVVFNTNIEETPQTSKLFIGHIGLLFEDDNKDLVFLEKLSFSEPYQLIKFKSRQELSDYLMAKYDVDTVSKIAVPFVMENDKLIEGYRPNLNKGKENE